MRKLNLIQLLLLCFILSSCQPKIEKKEPIIYNNNQNYKYDDDELTKKNSTDSIDDKNNLDKNKRSKVAVEK
jgi:hypothetical protein